MHHAHCTSFIATSLDGYISRLDGSIDWLEQANQSVPPGEDCGYRAYMETVDAIVMGRHSFETVLAFAQWPYADTPLYVLSSTLRHLPPRTPGTVSLHDLPPAELAALAASRGHRSLYIDGGKTIQRFVADGLLSEITITVIPVLLGSGRPLFGPLPVAEVPLRHVTSRSFAFGFVQHRYALVRGPA